MTELVDQHGSAKEDLEEDLGRFSSYFRKFTTRRIESVLRHGAKLLRVFSTN